VLSLLVLAALAAAQPVQPPVRVGLALSGGAALGFAHIGVLKVLEREGIPVVGVSGNSMGSLVGGMYAAGYTAAEIESLAVNADWGLLFSSEVPFGARYLPERRQGQRYVVQLRHRNLVPYLPGGLVPLQNVEFQLMELLADIEYDTRFDFDSLPIPYRAVAVDLVTGRRQVLRRGRLEQAIRASIAIPGVFAPERIGEQELVDGGVQQYLPVEPLLDFQPDVIIAVLTMKTNPETGISLVDIASRTMDVIGTEDLERQTELADVVIRPNVDPFMHSDFARARGLVAAGEAAAKLALPRIRAALGGRRPVSGQSFVVYQERPVVRSVRFEGLVVTRPVTVWRELSTGPGARLSFAVLVRDLERLFRTGLFDDVNYRLEPAPGDSTDLVIELAERAYGFYSLGARYDNSDDVALGLEVGQGNLAGTGASVRAALQLGNPTEVRLGLTGTRFFSFPLGYRLDGFAGEIDRAYVTSDTLRGYYATAYQGGVAEAGYILGRNAFFNVGATAYRAAYAFPPGVSPDSLLAEWIAGPRLHVEANSYADVEFPTAGAALQFDAAYSSPLWRSTREWLRLELAAERALPLSRRLLLRPGLDVGFSLGELAWAEQFRSGGADFVGFAANEFTSPHRAVARLGLDVRLLDLLGRDDYPVFLQAIGNVGTFTRPDRLVVEPGRLALLHWGAGLGLRTNTPLGPLQATCGFGDFLKPGSGRGLRPVFALSVGREFRYTR
jgi:NTE family protein